jgi:RimJ/RimL family protein N-acetyltransferase
MDTEQAAAGEGLAGGGSGAEAGGGGGAGGWAVERGGGGALETGIWLARSFRGRGVGREALRLVKARAASAGAAVLVAETTAGNVGALALLKYAGAELVTGAASETQTVPVIGKIPLR